MRSVACAFAGAFREQWIETAQPSQVISAVVGQLGAVAVFAWLARQSERQDVPAAIAFGVVLMVAWRASVFRLGFLVVGSSNQGTLELEMISRAPILWIMLGKTIAIVLFFSLAGAVCFSTVVIVAGRPEFSDPLALSISLAVAFVAVASFAFLFAPLTFLAGGQAGFFNAIFPLGILLSGFVQPVRILPPYLEAAARALPTAWATEALMNSLDGASIAEIAAGWGVAIALSAAIFGITAWMFVRCEALVREAGN